MTEKEPIKLITVRIMAVNVRGYETYDVLVVSTLSGVNQDEMDKIRIYIKESEFDNFKMLSIAQSFYTKLVKHRLLMGKKVYDKHLFKSYREIQELNKSIDNSTPFCGVKQLYIKRIKTPRLVLKKPRKGYIEVKSDTLRLKLRDDIIKQEKENYKNKKEIIT